MTIRYEVRHYDSDRDYCALYGTSTMADAKPSRYNSADLVTVTKITTGEIVAEYTRTSVTGGWERVPKTGRTAHIFGCQFHWTGSCTCGANLPLPHAIDCDMDEDCQPGCPAFK
jgi:hypothetical protein